MKFLHTLSQKYKHYGLSIPKDLAEAVNTIPATGSTNTSSVTPGATIPTTPSQVPDITGMSTNPETLKIKKETDDILKQVAVLLKKQASDAYNKLRTTTRQMP